MDDWHVNPNKRYKQFRQTRRKRARYPPTVNVDEEAGKHYVMNRFLEQCTRSLSMIDADEELLNDDEGAAVVNVSKPKRVRLPVLNECRGLFENAIIGKSSKKAVDRPVDVEATPEDLARLHEDIHALAKVGPESLFEFTPSAPKQSNGPADDLHLRPDSPQASDTELIEPGTEEPIPLEPPERLPSHHCDCCRRKSARDDLFEARSTSKSNDFFELGSLRIPSENSGNEIFESNRRGGLELDPLFGATSPGPHNILESTSQSDVNVGAPSTDFTRIEIQSFRAGVPNIVRGGRDDCQSGLEINSNLALTRGAELDQREIQSSENLLSRNYPPGRTTGQLMVWNKFSYNRQLSPRKY